MIKKTIAVFMILLLLCGCYDKVDIENIKSIALICVDNSKMYYCSVSGDMAEKKYNYTVYPIQTDDLNYGLNYICEQTGKKMSLSHLDAMLFSTECNYNLVKKSVNALLQKTNTHPKVMTAFFNGSFKEIFENPNIDNDVSLGKTIDKILTNKYTYITKCSAMELSCAINFDSAGKSVPVINLNNGQFEHYGSVYVDYFNMVYLDDVTTQFVELIKNKSAGNYVKFNNSDIFIDVSSVDINVNKQTAKLKINLNTKGIKDKKMLVDAINHFKQNVVNLNNNGFDIFGLANYLNKSFKSIPDKNEYLKKYNGINGWISNLNLDIEVII